MTASKSKPSTRDIVETAIDLTKEERSMSWDKMAELERQQNCRYEDDDRPREVPAASRKLGRRHKRASADSIAP